MKSESVSFIKGFSLIELIVTLGIFALITGLILARQGEFNNGILLTNLGYEVALSVRQAQVFGLGIRGSGVGNFSRPYGIYFNKNTPQDFIFFADGDNLRYIADTVDLVVETFSLRQGMTIDDFCARVVSSGLYQCKSNNGIEELNIVFVRPDPDAIFSSNIIESQNISSNYYEEAKIYIKSSGGVRSVVTVSKTGQISVSREQIQ